MRLVADDYTAGGARNDRHKLEVGKIERDYWRYENVENILAVQKLQTGGAEILIRSPAGL